MDVIAVMFKPMKDKFTTVLERKSSNSQMEVALDRVFTPESGMSWPMYASTSIC